MSENQPGDKQASRKRHSIEAIYQKKTQLEHILLRPDTYIGSANVDKQEMYVFDDEKQAIVRRPIVFSPGLYKIFDEILVNAADNKERDPVGMKCIKIDVDQRNHTISIFNDGAGIPVVIHKKEGLYVPSLIFGHLLTSSNYDDNQKKVTGGRNGFGAKLCNIFSCEFSLETASVKDGKRFRQTWSKNMTVSNEPVITNLSSLDKDYTCVTFKPDLDYFIKKSHDSSVDCGDLSKNSLFSDDFVALMKRRAYDIAGCYSKSLKIYFNKRLIHINSFSDYCGLYLKSNNNSGVEGEDNSPKFVYENVNNRWEVLVATVDNTSSGGNNQASFVNSIATTKGGTHVSYVMDKLVNYLTPIISRKCSDKQMLKPQMIKSTLFLFINCKIENPCFDSQTKEHLVLSSKKFGSVCEPSEKFLKSLAKIAVDPVVELLNFKSKTALKKLNVNTGAGKKTSGGRSQLGIPKLDDANFAGTAQGNKCTLILTEGDSAKSLAVAGLSVIGRDYFGAFPLRGKLLNVRNASSSVIIKNVEIQNLVKILGLNFKNKYVNANELKSLRYGRVMIMADQDNDGSHIKGLIINFIHSNWPDLLKHNYVCSFITPLIKAIPTSTSKNSPTIPFFSMPEFENWKNANKTNLNKFRIKYYKGLGTSTSAEAKDYFSNMDRHCISFFYKNNGCDKAIELAFSKEFADSRKIWLETNMQENLHRKQLNLPETHIYSQGISQISFQDFINKELVLFSNADNARSIPSMVDGLKPGQRKVLFTCFKKYEKKEIKVAQLAGAVAELTAYHHGEASLMSTIIGLAQNFVGSNNINLLMPIGQFGSRLTGGKDAASARYIFTRLNSVARCIFPEPDDHILRYMIEDNQRVEPEFYLPIIPMVLVNGAEGIGTGYSTKIPCYNYYELIDIVRGMINNQTQVENDNEKELLPWFRGFDGKITQIGYNKFSTTGVMYMLDEPNKFEIAELPIRVWTQNYKEDVLVPMFSEDNCLLTDMREYHSDVKVRFVIDTNKKYSSMAEQMELFKKLKLETTFTYNSMYLFDRNNLLVQYEKVHDIVKAFYQVRYEFYCKRKIYMENKLKAVSEKLTNQARFIQDIVSDKLVVSKRKKKDVIVDLERMGYKRDPVQIWKKQYEQNMKKETDGVEAVYEEEEIVLAGDVENEEVVQGDYDYLFSLSIVNLTEEKIAELLKQRDEKIHELNELIKKQPSQLWLDDLAALEHALKEWEQKEKDDEVNKAKKKQTTEKSKKHDESFEMSKKKKNTKEEKKDIKRRRSLQITPLRSERVQYIPEVGNLTEKKVVKKREPKEQAEVTKKASAIVKKDDVKKTVVKKKKLESSFEDEEDEEEVVEVKPRSKRAVASKKVVKESSSSEADKTVSFQVDSFYDEEDYM